jgi:hypothetical protein
MGCDIHVRIQHRNGRGWEDVPYASYLQRKYRFNDEPIPEHWPTAPQQLTARNYDTFGILANVRNGRGFAGAQTGSGWLPLAPERGLPDGIDPDGEPWLGDHSFTWMTLVELQAYPWDVARARLCGVVSRIEYEAWDRSRGGPSEYCGGISGPKIRVVDEATWTAMPTEERDNGTDWHIRVSWVETARSASGDWPGIVLPWLARFGKPDEVRLVIGFDS